VRELRNAAERYALGLPPLLPTEGPVGAQGEATLAAQVEAFERNLLIEALQRHRGVIAAVMHDLGLPRRTLNEKMQRYGLERTAYTGNDST
jgi:two-component system C4-dicarboxylate transport response regulator DctD